MEEKYLHFQVEGVLFGVPATEIWDIVPYDSARGEIIKINGELIPVFNIKEYFNLCKTEAPQKVIVTNGARKFGIMADKIVGILVTNPLGINKDLADVVFSADELVKGVVKRGIILLSF
ncbi:MAG: hypothetical protein HPY60_11035 [Candidatus Methanofastidiosum sp.]|nr:hypothetical protein [Methanofastidiosum sp.]